MRFGVIGAGAIGSLISALLKRSGHDVVLFVRRREAVEEIGRHGIRLEGSFGMITVKVEPTTRIERIHDREVTLVAVKAYDTAQVAHEIATEVAGGTIILTLQNGMGNADNLKALLPHTHVVAGSTTLASTLIEPGHIRWTGNGKTIIGKADDNTPYSSIAQLARTLTESGISTSTTKDLPQILWRKTLINAGINPVTALLGVANGEIASDSPARAFAIQIVREGAKVARAAGVRLPIDPVREMLRTAQETRFNHSSMLQDIENHGRTEIDYINGAISGYGRRHSIPTPLNNALWGAIRSLESLAVRASAVETPAA